MMRPLTIRWRLAAWSAVALAAILVVYAVVVFFLLRARLTTALDDRVHDDYEMAEANLEPDPQVGVRWRSGATDEDRSEPDRWVEVRAHDGATIHRECGTVGGARHRLPNEGLDFAGARSLELEPGFVVRLYQAEHRVGDHVVVVRTARSTATMERELRELWLVLALALPIGVLLAGGGGYVIARRALAPIAEMTARAREISAERLHERLAITRPDDELGELATVFNATFERLERSFAQLRQFTSDASHELRTPLATLRTVGEVGLRDGAKAEDLREVVSSMLEEVDRLTRLCDALLQLARADAGKIAVAHERVDLRVLASDVLGQLGVLADERGQSLLLEGEGDVFAKADPVLVRHALANLVHNAIAYAGDGAAICVALSPHDDVIEIAVRDDGPGIPPEHRERIFERFYRVDEARQRGGFGLGLAFARWAVEAQRGALTLEAETGRGCTFLVRLPR